MTKYFPSAYFLAYGENKSLKITFVFLSLFKLYVGCILSYFIKLFLKPRKLSSLNSTCKILNQIQSQHLFFIHHQELIFFWEFIYRIYNKDFLLILKGEMFPKFSISVFKLKRFKANTRRKNIHWLQTLPFPGLRFLTKKT